VTEVGEMCFYFKVSDKQVMGRDNLESESKTCKKGWRAKAKGMGGCYYIHEGWASRVPNRGEGSACFFRLFLARVIPDAMHASFQSWFQWED